MSLIGREIYDSISLMRALALGDTVLEDAALRATDAGSVHPFPAPAPVAFGERDELAERRRAR